VSPEEMMLAGIIDNIVPNKTNPYVLRKRQENPCGCDPRILLVDDQMFNFVPVKHLLKDDHSLGAETAKNGEEALAKFLEGF
jgi:PleD family two-component response regulator